MQRLTSEEKSILLRNQTNPVTAALANSVLPIGEDTEFYEGAAAGIVAVCRLLEAEQITIPSEINLLLESCVRRIDARQ